MIDTILFILYVLTFFIGIIFIPRSFIFILVTITIFTDKSNYLSRILTILLLALSMILDYLYLRLMRFKT